MMTKRILEGAGGGGSGSQTNTADSLLSNDWVEVVLGLSEGPIKGIVGDTDADKNRNTFIGSTPYVDAGGLSNFKEFLVTYYRGTPVDTPINFLLGGVTANHSSSSIPSVNLPVTLVQNTPVVRSWTPPTDTLVISIVELRIQIQSLYLSNSEGTFENTIQFTLEYRASTSGTWLQWNDWRTSTAVAPYEIGGKTTSGYVREYAMPLPGLATGHYEFRVTMTSPNSDTENFRSMAWESFQTTLPGDRSFPDVALLHVKGRATNQFTSVPDFSGIFDGWEMKVPSNYNPILRTYSGTWDGTFYANPTYTNNPAWVLYNLIVDERLGLARYYKNVAANRYVFYKAGQWCDELVPDGNGGTQPRFTFNELITQQRNGLELLQYIAGAFNSVLFDDENGTIHLKTDKYETPLQIFTPENVSAEGFQYSYSDISTRANTITVSFVNPQLEWSDDRRVYPPTDSPYIAENGRIPLDFIAVGCTDVQEATRRAAYRYVTANTEVTSVSFRTSRLGMLSSIFDTIFVADPDSGWSFPGRVKSIAGNVVSLRDPIYFTTTDPVTMTIQTAQDVTYPITGLKSGYVLTSVTVVPPGTGLQSSFTKTAGTFPYPMPEKCEFTLQGGSFGLPKPFKVMSITEDMPGGGAYTITALEVNVNKYSDVESSTTSTSIPYRYQTPDFPSQPVGLTARSGDGEIRRNPTTGELQSYIFLSWTRAFQPYTTRFEVEWQEEGSGRWANVSTTDDGVYLGPVLDLHTYNFQVTAVSPVGTRSKTVTLSGHVVPKKLRPPSNVVALAATNVGGAISITFDACPDPDYDHTELRTGVSWAAGVAFARLLPQQVFPFVYPYDGVPGARSIWAAHYNTSGIPSATPATVAVIVTVPTGLQSVTLDVSPREVRFADTLTNTAVTGSASLTATAYLSGLTGSPVFSAVAYNIAGSALGVISMPFVSGDPLVRTMTPAAFATYAGTDHVIITANLGGVTDDVTVYRLNDGSGLQFEFQNESVQVQADTLGNVASFAAAQSTLTMRQGYTDATSAWTFTLGTPVGCSATLNGGAGPTTGATTAAFTAMSAQTGYVDITASRSGYPSVVGRFKITKIAQGANGQRIGFLEVYRWKAVQPTTGEYPTGTSTFTWLDGTFTAPSVANGWALLPGAAVAGQTLWGISVRVSDALATTTSTATWNSTAPYAVGASGAPGAAGATAKTLTLSMDSAIFKRTSSGAITPSNAVIKLTAAKQNTSNTVTWGTAPGVTLYNAATGGASTTTGDIVYLRAADFGANTALVVTASIAADGLSDTGGIVSVKDGDLAPLVVLGNPSHPLPTDSAGTVSTYVGSGTTIQVLENGVARSLTSCTAAGSSITAGTPSATSGTLYTVSAHSVILATNASVLYTIGYTKGDGTAGTAYFTQTVYKNPQGVQGVAGAAGSNGIIVYAYKRSATPPVDYPNLVCTYTFANKQITVTGGGSPSQDSLGNGWGKTIPSGTDPLYIIAATAAGSGLTATINYSSPNDWSNPVKLVSDGLAGLNSMPLMVYARTATATPPAAVSANTGTVVTYTFASTSISNLNSAGPWTQGVPTNPVLTGGADLPYLWVATSAAASTGTFDDTLTWANPTLLAQDGADAPLLFLSSTSTAFVFLDAAATSSASPTVTMTANLQNATGTATFVTKAFNAANVQVGITDPITLAGSGTNTRTLTAAQFVSQAAVKYWTVTATLGALTDTVTITRVDGGANAVYVEMSNGSHSLTTDAAGAVVSGGYVGSGTTLKVKNGAGASIPYNATGTAVAGKWRLVTAAGSSITPDPSPSNDGTILTYTIHSGFSGVTASITYTLEYADASSVTTTLVAVQTFSRSLGAMKSPTMIGLYAWGFTDPLAPSTPGTSAYTWGASTPHVYTGTFWTVALPSNTTPGNKLWYVEVPISDPTGVATVTNVAQATWAAATRVAISTNAGNTYRCYNTFPGNGAVPGSASVTTASGTTYPAANSFSMTGADGTSTAQWGPTSGHTAFAGSAPALAPGQTLWVCDGITNGSGGVDWKTPYLSNFKVGTLSALQALLGNVILDANGSVASETSPGSGVGIAYAGTGVFLGYSPSGTYGGTSYGAAAYRFSAGSSTKFIRWDGSALTFSGDLNTTGQVVATGGASTGTTTGSVTYTASVAGVAPTAVAAIAGILGISTLSNGVVGDTTSATSAGVFGKSNSAGGYGIWGYAVPANEIGVKSTGRVEATTIIRSTGVASPVTTDPGVEVLYDTPNGKGWILSYQRSGAGAGYKPLSLGGSIVEVPGTGGIQVSYGFGCNSKTPQGSYYLGATAATNAGEVQTLVNYIRDILIANGIGKNTP